MTQKRRKPNVLLIMDDQHRYDYLGCAGARFLRTPTLDRLAARGVRFTQCTTNSPSCVPARIALATGLQPARTGVLESTQYLPRRLPTIYQHFRDHEYRVGLVGKADLAKADKYNGVNGDRPCAFTWGFTHPLECEGKIHASRARSPLGPYTAYLEQKGLLEAFVEDYARRREHGWVLDACHDSVLAGEDVEDAFIGRKAAEWIRSIGDDFPWFLSVSFVGPHDPFDPPADYARRYAGTAMPEPVAVDSADKPAWLAQRATGATTEQVAHTRRQYCALIELIDDQVGSILEALDATGTADDTIVVFTSDHGEMLGDRGFYKKSVMYEPALRVPLIVAGPDVTPARSSDALVESIDLNATLAELAGLPQQGNLDSRSFAGLLRGVETEHREETVSFLDNCRCVRTRRYKYIETFNDLDELYDLHEDPRERINVADKQRAALPKFRGLLRRRLREGAWLR